jgi:hypothetical protein
MKYASQAMVDTADIQIKHLPETFLERYRYSDVSEEHTEHTAVTSHPKSMHGILQSREPSGSPQNRKHGFYGEAAKLTHGHRQKNDIPFVN